MLSLILNKLKNVLYNKLIEVEDKRRVYFENCKKNNCVKW